MKKILFVLGLLWANNLQAQSVSVSTKGNAATHTICDDGCAGSGGTSAVDGASFSLGVDAFTPGGGTYNTTLVALSSGVSAAFRINKYRAIWSMLTDGAGAELGVTANPLVINCNSGCGSPPATADNTAFTAGTTNVTPVAGVYDDSVANLTTGRYGAPRLTISRALHVNLRSATGVIVDLLTDTQLRATPVTVSGTVTSNIGTTNGLALDATVTARFPTGANPANAESNTASISRVGSYNFIYNGATWDRWTGAVSGTVTANIGTTNGLFLDATYTGRMPAGASPASAESNTNTALSRIGSFNFIYNGSTWDRWTGAVTQSGTWNIGSITTLPALVASSALIGQTANTAQATTTNSTVPCYITSAASTNSTSCKGSAGNIYGFDLINTTATLYYLRLYNSSSAPTCSSATGFIRTIPIPASVTGAGITRDISAGEGYSTGIGFCLTGGGSSTDNTNAATGVYITIQYKH